MTETTPSGSTSSWAEYTITTPWGAEVTYEQETTPSGATECLTSTVETKSDGRTVTYVTGTGTRGQPVTYTVVPSSSPSYIPTPSSYTDSTGAVISYVYTPTPSGYDTITYEYVPTKDGYETVVYSPTSSGISTYVQNTAQSTTSRGGITSYIDLTTSSGGHETITETYTQTISGGSEVIESVVNSSGVPTTYETETYATPSGATYTYEDITYPSGTVEFTSETFTTSDFGTGSWVTEVLPNGQSLTYTVLPPSSSDYVPSPVTYSTTGEQIIYSYVPTPSGTETITYVEH